MTIETNSVHKIGDTFVVTLLAADRAYTGHVVPGSECSVSTHGGQPVRQPLRAELEKAARAAVADAITASTTLDQLAEYLDSHGFSYTHEEHDGGALRIGDLGALVYWDEQDPQAIGWAYRFGQESDALDSFEELRHLALLAA